MREQTERYRPLVLPALVALLLGIMACAEYPGIPRQLSSESIPGSAGLLPASGSGPNPASESGSPELALSRQLEIELRDFELSPSDFTVPAGEITFTLVNAGRFTHDFRVEGEAVDEKSPRVSAGRQDDWSITLAPGTYRISCPISNHADRGMVGTLTVIPSD